MTSSTATRRIVVDDSNRYVFYYGDWAADSKGSLDGSGSSGPTFQRTTHRGPGGDFGTASFSFEGSSISVYGRVAGNSADGTEPGWECRVDGQIIGNNAQNIQPNQNNQLLCSTDGLGNYYHSINLQTTSDRMWIDYFEYTPTTNNPYQNPGSFLSISNRDPDLDYDNSWSRSDSALVTSTTGATLNTTFVGTSLIWYGSIPAGAAGNATGTYSIDGQLPVTFVINRSASTGNSGLSNQIFFETPLLPWEQHSISVTYTAGGDFPLSLDRLVVRDQVAVIPAASVSMSGAWGSAVATAGSTASDPYRGNPMSGGAIAATVIGSVLGFAILVLAFLFLWRRCRRARAVAAAQTSTEPSGTMAPQARPLSLGDEKAAMRSDSSSVFSMIREKIKKEKEELDYSKPPVETEQLPAYKARNSGVQIEVEDRV